jgi:hypothetical protein
MKFTIEERHEIYKLALDIFKSSVYRGICAPLSEAVCRLYSVEVAELFTIDDLPEIAKYEKAHKKWWWHVPDRDVRIKVLEKEIEATKVKNKEDE